jgi:hypothetical protein
VNDVLVILLALIIVYFTVKYERTDGGRRVFYNSLIGLTVVLALYIASLII